MKYRESLVRIEIKTLLCEHLLWMWILQKCGENNIFIFSFYEQSCLWIKVDCSKSCLVKTCSLNCTSHLLNLLHFAILHKDLQKVSKCDMTGRFIWQVYIQTLFCIKMLLKKFLIVYSNNCLSLYLNKKRVALHHAGCYINPGTQTPEYKKTLKTERYSINRSLYSVYDLNTPNCVEMFS